MDQQSEVFQEDEDVRGVVIVAPANEMQVVKHDGIKITLIGIIGNKISITRYRSNKIYSS